jgi:hypothetical protein
MPTTRKIAVYPNVGKLSGTENVTVQRSDNPFPFTATADEVGASAEIAAETAARQAADTSLANAIATETAARIAGDTGGATAAGLASEVLRAVAAETMLESTIGIAAASGTLQSIRMECFAFFMAGHA